MNDHAKDKWEKHYHSCSDEFPAAAEVLIRNQHLLSEHGTALYLACGLGSNAICLAENSLATSQHGISLHLL